MDRSVVVVTNIPRPYRHALFGVVREQLAARGFRLQVLYTSDPSKHARRGSQPTVQIDSRIESFVPGLALRTSYERVISVPRGLGTALDRCAPACVVAGGFGLDALLAARWCHRTKVPHVVWSGAWPGREGTPGALALMTRRRLVEKAQGFIAYGTAAADYLIELGASPGRVFCAWNTTDLETGAAMARAAAANRPELSSKWGLAERNIAYVGTMVESKGLRELVSAALLVEPETADWALHLVGDGPLRQEMLERVRASGRGAHVRLHGLRPQIDVWELFGLVDGFVLPTKREAWGLVINEAMACGVPVVTSPQAGATRDLIVHGVTGYVVEPSDVASLAAIMRRLLDDPSCQEVGLAGAQAVRAKASLEKSAQGFVDAIACAMQGCIR